MSFINTVAPAEASGPVLEMYQHQEKHWGFVPNYAKTFSHRPEVMARWGRLLAEIRRPVDTRRFELVTLAVALELKHSPCALTHGKALARIVGEKAVIALADGRQQATGDAVETAIVEFARKIARDAASVSAQDVMKLKEQHGLSDAEIFDIAAIAAGRCFFTKILDALGSAADSSLGEIPAPLRDALTVGRPIEDQPPENIAAQAGDPAGVTA